MSSEDNLSHDSYELIEKDDDAVQNNNDMTDIVNESLDNNRIAIDECKMDKGSINMFNTQADHLNDPSTLLTNNRKGSNQFEARDYYR